MISSDRIECEPNDRLLSCSSFFLFDCLLNISQRDFLPIAAVVPRLNVQLLVVLIDRHLLLIENAVDELLIGRECLQLPPRFAE